MLERYHGIPTIKILSAFFKCLFLKWQYLFWCKVSLYEIWQSSMGFLAQHQRVQTTFTFWVTRAPCIRMVKCDSHGFPGHIPQLLQQKELEIFFFFLFNKIWNIFTTKDFFFAHLHCVWRILPDFLERSSLQCQRPFAQKRHNLLQVCPPIMSWNVNANILNLKKKTFATILYKWHSCWKHTTQRRTI